VWTVTEVIGVAGGRRDVVVENLESIGGNRKKEREQSQL